MPLDDWPPELFASERASFWRYRNQTIFIRIGGIRPPCIGPAHLFHAVKARTKDQERLVIGAADARHGMACVLIGNVGQARGSAAGTARPGAVGVISCPVLGISARLTESLSRHHLQGRLGLHENCRHAPGECNGSEWWQFPIHLLSSRRRFVSAGSRASKRGTPRIGRGRRVRQFRLRAKN